jgi:hypothetical protein
MSKISLEGNASGSGTLTIAAPNTNSNFTLSLPSETGTIVTSASSITASQLPAGSVLQVVQQTEVAGSTGTTQTVDIISKAITPSSASSRILIIGHISYFSPEDHGTIRVKRNSTELLNGTTGTTLNGTVSASFDNNNYGDNGNASYGVGTIMYVDSPNTTSSVTYTFTGRTTGPGAAWYVNRAESTYQGSTSSIILMEIAG